MSRKDLLTVPERLARLYRIWTSVQDEGVLVDKVDPFYEQGLAMMETALDVHAVRLSREIVKAGKIDNWAYTNERSDFCKMRRVKAAILEGLGEDE